MIDPAASYPSLAQNLRRRIGRIVEQRWVNVSLRTKMGLLVEIGLLGLIGVFLVLSISATRQSTRQILYERRNLARLSAAAIDSSLHHLANSLSAAAGRISVGDPLQRSQTINETYDLLAPTVRGVYLLSPDLQVMASRTASSPPIDWRSLSWPAVPAPDQLPLKLLALDNAGLAGLPLAVIAAPLPVQDGQPSGWLAALLDFHAAQLSPFENVFELGATGTIDLVTAGGHVLGSSNPAAALPLPEEVLNRLFIAGLPGVETCLGCSDDSTASSSDEVVAFAPLTQAPWGVVVRQKASELMAPVNQLLFQTLLLGVVTVAGALLLVRITTSSVIRPVQRLQEAAQKIAAGDLEAPLGQAAHDWRSLRRQRNERPAADRDEISALAASFEEMRLQLKRSIDEVQAFNRELDARVQERTAAARQAQLEAQAARDDLLRRNQQLSILNAIGSAVNQSLDLQTTLENALDAVLGLAEVDMGAIYLEGELQGDLQLAAQRGISPQAARLAAEIGLLDGACGGVLQHGQLVVVPDLSHYHGRRARSLKKEGLNALVHVPLNARGRILGSLCLGIRSPREVSSQDQALLEAMGSQIAAAVENARLYAELQQKDRLRSELFRKAITAQEDERRRIARELHDDTSQALAALIYAAEEAAGMKSLVQARKRIHSMHALLQHTLDGIHKLIFDLRPSMLDHLGLAPAVARLARTRLEEHGVKVTIYNPVAGQRLPPEIETALYRVLQEAINNIARHAAARNVKITYCVEPVCARIVIEDDGIGFDLTEPGPTPDSPRGLGLLGMQERLELLGGELSIASAPGAGTALQIIVPLQPQPSSPIQPVHHDPEETDA